MIIHIYYDIKSQKEAEFVCLSASICLLATGHLHICLAYDSQNARENPLLTNNGTAGIISFTKM